MSRWNRDADFVLMAPDNPQAQRFAFAQLFKAAQYIASQPFNQIDAWNLLDACQCLVKWGTVELEHFSWDDEEPSAPQPGAHP